MNKFPHYDSNKYKVGKTKKRIGSGGFGNVDRFTNFYDPHGFAIKKYGVAFDDYPILENTVLSEISFLTSVKHPNIVELLDIANMKRFEGLKQGPRLVFEYAGKTFTEAFSWCGMFEYLCINRDERFNQRVRVMKQCFVGLEFMHRNGIWHRDIKTANLLIDKDGHVRYCDFGSSKIGAFDGAKYTSEVQTVWWRSPEVLYEVGEHYDSKIDVYSLGVVFTDILTQSCLFYSSCEAQLARKMITFLGRMMPEDWPELYTSSSYFKHKYGVEVAQKHLKGNLKEMMMPYLMKCEVEVPQWCFDMIYEMLTPNPSKRPSVLEVIEKYFHGQLDLTQGTARIPQSGVLEQEALDVESKCSNDIKLMWELASKHEVEKHFAHGRELFLRYVAAGGKETVNVIKICLFTARNLAGGIFPINPHEFDGCEFQYVSDLLIKLNFDIQPRERLKELLAKYVGKKTENFAIISKSWLEEKKIPYDDYLDDLHVWIGASIVQNPKTTLETRVRVAVAYSFAMYGVADRMPLELRLAHDAYGYEFASVANFCRDGKSLVSN